MSDKPSSILLESESIVNGAEQAQNRKYGPPSEVFSQYADIFNAINPNRVTLQALDVAYVMLAVKLGRERTHHKRDNLVDSCGYLEIVNKIRVASPTASDPDRDARLQKIVKQLDECLAANSHV